MLDWKTWQKLPCSFKALSTFGNHPVNWEKWKEAGILHCRMNIKYGLNSQRKIPKLRTCYKHHSRECRGLIQVNKGTLGMRDLPRNHESVHRLNSQNLFTCWFLDGEKLLILHCSLKASSGCSHCSSYGVYHSGDICLHEHRTHKTDSSGSQSQGPNFSVLSVLSLTWGASALAFSLVAIFHVGPPQPAS